LKTADTTDSEKKAKTKGKLRENIEAIAVAIILALFIRTFIVQAFKIPSGSMEDTLLIGDHILVNKFIYGVKVPFTQITAIPITDPERGDIVVFRYPEEPDKDFIKRVVGVGGDQVEIKDKAVYVNGQILAADFAKFTDNNIIPERFSHRDNFGPITVPEDKVFVMGDNRDNSHDSRFWGFVDVSAVKGEAFMIYWSWNRGEKGVRWGRIGNVIR
jgi:signal peptidase I